MEHSDLDGVNQYSLYLLLLSFLDFSYLIQEYTESSPNERPYSERVFHFTSLLISRLLLNKEE